MNPWGGVNFWNNENNEPILHPKPKDNMLLAAFACVPLVGCIPTHEAWQGVDLPRHGVLLRGNDLPITDHMRTNNSSRYSYTFHFEASSGYPWAYSVKVEVNFRHDANLLTYCLTVTRPISCTNERPMPLSFGLSSYVALYGAPCTVFNGSTEIWHSGRLLHREGERFRTNLTPLTLVTGRGRLLISQQTIFDDAELWSRDPGTYLNVVVSAGRNEPMLLQPGEMRTGTVGLTYQRT